MTQIDILFIQRKKELFTCLEYHEMLFNILDTGEKADGINLPAHPTAQVRRGESSTCTPSFQVMRGGGVMPTYSLFQRGGLVTAHVPPHTVVRGDGDRPMYPLIPRRGGGKSPRTISFQEGGAYVPPHSRKCGGNNKMSTIYIIFINAKIEVLNKLLQTRDSLDKQEKYFIVLNLQSV